MDDVKSESNGKHILSIEEMLGADQTEYAEIPAWKIKDPKTGEMIQGYVRIGSLTAEEMAEFRETVDGPAKKTSGMRLFVNSLVDKDGKRIGNQSHYAAFKKTSNAVQERVLAKIMELNGLTTKAGVEAKNE